MPVISVLFPYKNESTYIEESLRSVLEQTFDDIEVLALDDGSTDDSTAIVRRIDDSRVKIINTGGVGLPLALNIGISEASGDFIARMDADDIALPERFESQLQFMIENPSVDLVGCQARLINDKGEVLGNKNKPVGVIRCTAYARYATPIIHPSFFGRLSLFRRLEGYKNLMPGQDYEFVVRALRSGAIIDNLNEVLILYRVTQKGVCQRNPRKTIYISNWIRKNSCSSNFDIARLTDDRMYSGSTSDSYFMKLYALRNKSVDVIRRGALWRKFFAFVALFFVVLLSPQLRQDSLSGYRSMKILNSDAGNKIVL